MSILNEDLLVNRDTFETIKDFQVTCEICLGILMNPKQCTLCETTFCNICISEWTQKHNSCPMRCNNFKIADPPRVLKNMLAKLEFKCEVCKLNFAYEKFCTHIDECKNTKCPVCGNNQFSKEDLERHNASIIEPYEKEILKLQNEVKSYKEIINLMNEEISSGKGSTNITVPLIAQSDLNVNQNSCSSSSLSTKTIKWPKSQKKMDFTLSDYDRKMDVNYSSCWNIHYADTVYNTDKDVTFKVKVLNKGTKFDHHYIGFINSSYSNDCLCLYKSNAWYLHNAGDNFKEANRVLISNVKMSMEAGVPKTYQFTINGHTGKVSIASEDGEIYGTTYMTGKDFTFFVSKCNGGTFEYTFLQ
jgi:hypothetical protein